MTDGRGLYCEMHPGSSMRCFCDEERDRLRGMHRCSGLDDGFGGYMCICLETRYGLNGCMATGRKEEDYVFKYEMRKKYDALLRAIVWRLPERLVMWAYIRVGAHATTGQYGNTVVPELTMMDALDRWPTK